MSSDLSTPPPDQEQQDVPVGTAPEASTPETPQQTSERILRTSNRTINTSIALTVLWLYAYNLIAHEMGPVLAFFKIMDGLNDLVLGMVSVVIIGLGIVTVYTLTTLFTFTITNLYSARILEDLIRDHLSKREFRVFFAKLITFNQLPKPESPFPRTVASTIWVLTFQYLVSWFYLVIFTECLYFAAWSAGVYVDLYPESMNTIPLFAIAVPFTARIMAYLKFPWAENYAAFIPGILFVVVLLLAFVGAMGGPFQYFVVDIYNRDEAGFFAQGALLWKFLRDGCLIAFYPVFGEVIFFYLQHMQLKREAAAAANPSALPPL